MLSAVAWVGKGVSSPQLVATEDIRVGKKEEEEAVRKAQKELKLAAGCERSGEEEDMDEDDEEGSEDGGQEIAAAELAASNVGKLSGKRTEGSMGEGGGRRRGASRIQPTGIEGALAGLDMDAYDDEEDESPAATLLERAAAEPGIGRAILLDDSDEEEEEVEEEDKEALEIRPDDLIVLGLRTEEDVNTLEMWIYETGDGAGMEGNLYVHHDVLLTDFPLCLSWMGCSTAGDNGSYVAVGSFDPAIEVWNLDEMDPVEPICLLGSPGHEQKAAQATRSGSKKKVKKGPKGTKAGERSTHTEAVMSLAWNSEYRNVLASGSADTSILIWDVALGKANSEIAKHTGKVQALAWNPHESHVLLSAAFDKKVMIHDVRDSSQKPTKWKIEHDAEACAWDLHSHANFFVSTEAGVVYAMDARQADKAVYTFEAHKKETTCLTFCPAVKGLLATASTDAKVKLWDISAAEPRLIGYQNIDVGAVFGAQFCVDEPFLIAGGGAKGGVAVWDIRASDPIKEFIASK